MVLNFLIWRGIFI